MVRVKVIDFLKIDEEKGKNVLFLRVDPEDITVTLRDIIDALSDLSWISKFDKEYLRASYQTRAETTVKHICKKIQDGAASGVYGDAAEYIVSETARETLVGHLKYKDVPLGELFKEQVSGNPGFDYFTANLSEVIIFGEAKYLAAQNAYGTGMGQTARFITEGRDKADIADIQNFFSDSALTGVYNGTKGFSVAFSAKNTASAALIQGIKRNAHYAELSGYQELIFVAVNI